MSQKLAKYWIVGIVIGVIVSFGFGTFLGPSVLATSIPLPPNPDLIAVNHAIEKLGKEMSQISNDLSQIKNKTSVKEAPQVTKNDISNLEKQIKVLGTRLDKLDSLSGDVSILKRDISTLKTPLLARVLSAELDKSEYNAGDSLTISGVGLPNGSVTVSLFGSDNMLISKGSTVSDSSGKFTFTTHLSRSLSDGTYTLKIGQGITFIEKVFRIVSVPVQGGERLTLTTDSTRHQTGNMVLLSGVTSPNTWVDLEVRDSHGIQVVKTSTKSDAFGRYTLTYFIPNNAVLGDYEAMATVGGKRVSIIFSVSSSILTITTDKATYYRGNLVKITGKAPSNSKINITAALPSGDTRVLISTATGSGNYVALLYIDSSASTGTWNLIAKQGVYTAASQISVI